MQQRRPAAGGRLLAAAAAAAARAAAVGVRARGSRPRSAYPSRRNWKSVDGKPDVPADESSLVVCGGLLVRGREPREAQHARGKPRTQHAPCTLG